jgi:hypothetical protein
MLRRSSRRYYATEAPEKAEEVPAKRVNTSMCPHVGSRGPQGRRESARWPHAVSVAAPCGATSSSTISSPTPTRRVATVGAGSVPKARWPQTGSIAPHVAASTAAPHVGAAPQGGSNRGTHQKRAALWRPRGRPCGAWPRPSSTASPSSSATRSWASPGLARRPSHPERHPRGHHGPAVCVPA